MTSTVNPSQRQGAYLDQEEALLLYRAKLQQAKALEEQRAGVIMEAKLIAKVYNLRVAERSTARRT